MIAPTLPGYDVLGPLGSGGSAQVWRATRQFDGLSVALKVLRPATGDLDAALAEAGLLAGVRHTHVVHLYDVLPLAGEQGRPEAVVLVTQLAAGGSLAQVLARRQLLVPGEVVTVLHPVAMTLSDLHHRGIVHGDLSGGNILFRSDGMPLLADLGTAAVAGERPMQGLGTQGHDGMVAPEVVEGFPATAASDVYQVGALAWLSLVGEPPGPGFDRPPLAQVAPDLSPMVLDLVTRCMAPEPEDRPDAQEVGAALMEIASPEPVEVAPDADAAHGVTQRLRQVALQDEAEAEPGPARAWWNPRWRAAPSRTGPAAKRPGTARSVGLHRARRGADHGAPDGSARPPLLVSGLVVLVMAALAAMVLTLLVPWVRPASDPASKSTSTPTSTSTSTPSSTPTLPAAAVPRSTPAPAPESEPEDDLAPEESISKQELQVLLDRRAAAWQATDPALLATVVLPGSSAQTSERAALEGAQDAGIEYPDVSFRVQDLKIVATRDEVIVVKAQVWSGPVEAYEEGQVVLRAPEREDTVRMELAADETGWLLKSWEETTR